MIFAQAKRDGQDGRVRDGDLNNLKMELREPQALVIAPTREIATDRKRDRAWDDI